MGDSPPFRFADCVMAGTFNKASDALHMSRRGLVRLHSLAMGNCMNVPQYPPLQKIKNFIFCVEEDFNLALQFEKIASGAYQGSKLASHGLTSGSMLEVGREVPLPAGNDNGTKPAELCRLRKVKIVVSKEQLELLLRNSRKFGSKGIAVQFSETFEFDNVVPDGGLHCLRFQRSRISSFV